MPVYISFFAAAGANLHLDVLLVVGGPAVPFVMVRGVGLFAGSALGARIAEAPALVRRYAGFGLLPQAGLALALRSRRCLARPSIVALLHLEHDRACASRVLGGAHSEGSGWPSPSAGKVAGTAGGSSTGPPASAATQPGKVD